MEQPGYEWASLRETLHQARHQELGIDCAAVGIATQGASALQIQKILFLEGEIHADPVTLQSHCASLIAVSSALRTPLVLDLGRCACVGQQLPCDELQAERRFSVHARALGNGQVLFAVASSTTPWDESQRVKALVVELTDRAHLLCSQIESSTRPPATDEEPDKTLNWYLFTAREVEILKLVAAGLSNKRIAREISASPNTVRNHIHAVFRKAGVSNRTELALRATVALA